MEVVIHERMCLQLVERLSIRRSRGWMERSLLVCLTVRLRAMSPKGIRIHPNTLVRATLHIRDGPFPNLSRGYGADVVHF